MAYYTCLECGEKYYSAYSGGDWTCENCGGKLVLNNE